MARPGHAQSVAERGTRGFPCCSWRNRAPGEAGRPFALAHRSGSRRMNLMSARADAMTAFLAGAGWGPAERHPLPGDASTRRYIRLRLGDRTAMLMAQPQAAEAPVAGPDATAEERLAL